MKYIAGAVVMGMGLVGIHFQVEYSGWVIFVGAIVMVS
jgi:hypothetical protein